LNQIFQQVFYFISIIFKKYWYVTFLSILGVFLLSGGIMAISRFVPTSNPHRIKAKSKILPSLPIYDLNGDG
jgi:hypothetical protein